MSLHETQVSLQELQMTFLHDIFDARGVAAAALIVGHGVEPEQRLAIYRVTALENVEKSLRLSFPAVARLIGDEYFNQCVREYRRVKPSRSGDVGAIGGEFADFLATLHAADRFAYLADVARLEWFYQEALSASDLPALDLSALAAVPSELCDSLCLCLHPAVRLFRSVFPVLRIWEANVRETSSADIIDLAMAGERVLLGRIQGHVECQSLTEGEFEFLQELSGGSGLAAAIAAASTRDVSFDAAAALQRFVLSAVIVDFHFSTERSRSE